MALITCKDCGKEFSSDAKRCVHCGANKAVNTNPLWLVLTIGGFLWLIISVLMHENKDARNEFVSDMPAVTAEKEITARPPNAEAGAVDNQVNTVLQNINTAPNDSSDVDVPYPELINDAVQCARGQQTLLKHAGPALRKDLLDAGDGGCMAVAPTDRAETEQKWIEVSPALRAKCVGELKKCNNPFAMNATALFVCLSDRGVICDW